MSYISYIWHNILIFLIYKNLLQAYISRTCVRINIVGDKDLLFMGYYEFIYLGLLQFKQISYPLKFPCTYVIMPFTKATQGTINREGTIKQPWKFDFELTIISPDPTTHSQLESNQLMPFPSPHTLFRSHHHLDACLNILDSERFIQEPYLDTRISFHKSFS